VVREGGGDAVGDVVEARLPVRDRVRRAAELLREPIRILDLLNFYDQIYMWSPEETARRKASAGFPVDNMYVHLLKHGFDDQGSKYDGNGRLTDWWTTADRSEFEKRTAALIEQYSVYSPAQFTEPHQVNGALTIGENIGDLGGFAIALNAYRISLEGAESPVLDGLTGLQRAIVRWAQTWQTKVRDEEALRRLATDPHSPPEFRCNGVLRNIDEFYAAFDVKPGDALYLDPDRRVSIW